MRILDHYFMWTDGCFIACAANRIVLPNDPTEVVILLSNCMFEYN